jgi:hypothetical protein
VASEFDSPQALGMGDAQGFHSGPPPVHASQGHRADDGRGEQKYRIDGVELGLNPHDPTLGRGDKGGPYPVYLMK